MKQLNEYDFDLMLKYGISIPQEYVLKHLIGMSKKDIQEFMRLQSGRYTSETVPDNVIAGDFNSDHTHVSA